MGGAGGAPRTPSPGTALCSQRYNCLISPALLGTPLGETALDHCSGTLTPSSLWDVPTSSAAHQLAFAFGIAAGGAMDRGP